MLLATFRWIMAEEPPQSISVCRDDHISVVIDAKEGKSEEYEVHQPRGGRSSQRPPPPFSDTTTLTLRRPSPPSSSPPPSTSTQRRFIPRATHP